MNIRINVVPHHQQRYQTVGDWQIIGGNLLITVTDLNDRNMEHCIALHELVEALLCHQRGISAKLADAFDMEFEQERILGRHADEAEPGDDLACPYRDEHRFATVMERMFASELGVDWKEYSDRILAV